MCQGGLSPRGCAPFAILIQEESLYVYAICTVLSANGGRRVPWSSLDMVWTRLIVIVAVRDCLSEVRTCAAAECRAGPRTLAQCLQGLINERPISTSGIAALIDQLSAQSKSQCIPKRPVIAHALLALRSGRCSKSAAGSKSVRLFRPTSMHCGSVYTEMKRRTA